VQILARKILVDEEDFHVMKLYINAINDNGFACQTQVKT